MDTRGARRHHVSMRYPPEIEAKYDRWYDRALKILDGRANGMGLPVLRALALRGHPYAMAALANRLTDPYNSDYDPKRGMALTRAVARKLGESWTLENLAVTCRNRNDMAGYRYWIARASLLGEPEVVRERGEFCTRFPYAIMRRWKRYRPLRKGE